MRMLEGDVNIINLMMMIEDGLNTNFMFIFFLLSCLLSLLFFLLYRLYSSLFMVYSSSLGS